MQIPAEEEWGVEIVSSRRDAQPSISININTHNANIRWTASHSVTAATTSVCACVFAFRRTEATQRPNTRYKSLGIKRRRQREQEEKIERGGDREWERERERARESKKTQPFFFTSLQGLSPTTRAGLEQDVRIKARILNGMLKKKKSFLNKWRTGSSGPDSLLMLP